jgi:RNA polymerase sigma factor (sigma-70 family)
MDDRQLLAQFVTERSAEAFAELVRRYADLVYSSARRQLGKSDLAEDVSQAVFLLLSRKAGRVQGPLGGWLIKTTHFVCRDARKMAERRRERERRAAEMKTQELREPASSRWDDYAGLLDGALAKLPRLDRDAVVLHFMQGMTLRETGDALGISQDVARKRAGRALERLRNSLASQMVMPGVGVLASHLIARGIEAAPAHLVGKIAGSTLAAHNATAASIGLKTGYGMVLSKFKVAAIVALVFVVAAAAGSSVAHLRAQNSTVQPVPPPPSVAGTTVQSSPSAEPAILGDVVQILRYDVLLNDGAFASLGQLKSQQVATAPGSLRAAVFETDDLHRVIVDAINLRAAESVSIVHAFTSDTWAAGKNRILLSLDKQPSAARAWVGGGGVGSIDSNLVDPDHRAMKLDFSAIHLRLMEGAGLETDSQASIAYGGTLTAGQSLVFTSDLSGSSGAVHHLLIVFEAIKAPDWQMNFYYLARDLRWYLRSGPQGVSALAARAVVWAASATHSPEDVPSNYEQTLPDGTIARATAIMRIDTYPLCWWDGQGQAVNAPQAVPILTQYFARPTFIEVEVAGPPEAWRNSSPLGQSSATTRPGGYQLFTVLNSGHTMRGALWAPYGPWKQLGQIEMGQSIEVNRISYALRSVSENASGEVMADLHTDQAGGDAITLTAVLKDGREMEPANSDGLIGKMDPNPSPVFFGFKAGDVQYFHVWQRKRQFVSFPDFPERPVQPPETNVTPEQVNAALAKLQQSQALP